MASSVDICNLSLSHLGDEATVTSIDPPEGSPQAAHCKTFYTIARDQLLEEHAWSFATKRVALAQISSATPSEWSYAYAAPADLLGSSSILNIFSDGNFTGKGDDFIIETTDANGIVIYTNTETAYCRYVKKVTDTTKFTPMFVNTLSYLLASFLAGPVVKGETGMQVAQGMIKMYNYQLAIAKSSDASARQLDIKHTPDHISVRGMNTQTPDAWIKR